MPLPDEQTLLIASGGYLHCLHIPSEEIIRKVRLREPADDARWLVAASADRLVLVYRQREALLLEV